MRRSGRRDRRKPRAHPRPGGQQRLALAARKQEQLRHLRRQNQVCNARALSRCCAAQEDYGRVRGSAAARVQPVVLQVAQRSAQDAGAFAQRLRGGTGQHRRLCCLLRGRRATQPYRIRRHVSAVAGEEPREHQRRCAAPQRGVVPVQRGVDARAHARLHRIPVGVQRQRSAGAARPRRGTRRRPAPAMTWQRARVHAAGALCPKQRTSDRPRCAGCCTGSARWRSFQAAPTRLLAARAPAANEPR